ncbi:putative protein kinase [Leptomonas pyrrhocoris]|uniref:non-specific serine/threonine protein kinase n=1 Tax=Leptomonas pyrrhocoris TaxID=157538 RepID=A0A0N0DS32_LEPPY|nr:putative protein kinase [Leptomonas pyrrhocoris]KPA75322.1 putative protein kinase [Leptomonas pyrrhocoris]|eukprot:XP_015653761.1 putative protein kinase [Leptomonas pyrrhocoris]
MSDSNDDSSNGSSSDDDIFTEHVDFKKKATQRRVPIHTASNSTAPTTTTASSAKTDARSPTSREEPRLFTTAVTADVKLASSAVPSAVASVAANPFLSAEGQSLNINTTTASELSVAALQAILGSDVPVTQRSASTNTEASSSNNDPSSEDRRKLRRRRRLVGGARPPLHKSTLTAASAPVGGDDLSSLLPPTNVPSSTSERDARDTPELSRRRSNLHSASTGDLATASSVVSASNELPAVATRRANSPAVAAASPRARHAPRSHHQHPHQHLHTVGSASALGNSLQSSALPVSVAAHLLSDEAYLDTFKIPALMAQLSLSLMAAKPVDPRAFTRDWLADRLVSEEDEDDDEDGHQGSGSMDADLVNVSSAPATGIALSPERESTRSYGIGPSSSMSDALSNHSSAPNVDPGSSNTTSLQASTMGGAPQGGSTGPPTAPAPAAASVRKRTPYSRASSATNDAQGEPGKDDDDNTASDTSSRLDLAPPKLIVMTSEQPTLMEAAAKAQTGAERKGVGRRNTGATDGGKCEGRQRKKKNERGGSGNARRGTATATATGKHEPPRRGTRSMASPVSNARSGASSPSPAPTPTKAAQHLHSRHSSPHSSSPNLSIMKTMSPAEASIMTDAEKAKRAKMLVDMAEAAFLHQASEEKEKTRARKQSDEGGSAGPALETDGTADTAAKSASSSSSSASFFDAPHINGGGWAHLELSSARTTNAPSSTVSNKGSGDLHDARHRGRSPLRSSSLLSAPDSDEPNHTTTTVPSTTSPPDRHVALIPSGSTSPTLDSSSYAAAMTKGTTAQGSVVSAASLPSTLSPEPDTPAMAVLEKEAGHKPHSPLSWEFQTPRSSTAEQSPNVSTTADQHAATNVASKKRSALAENGSEENRKASSSSSSSSSGNGSGDAANFAMFSPLLAVDRHTNEVIDYRTTAGAITSQPSFLGAPPLNIPSGVLSRTATPPRQSNSAGGYLVSSLGGGTNVGGPTSTSNTATSAAAVASGGLGNAASNPYAPFPPYAPRATTGGFNLLPTPMLADMVGGNGVTNSSFGRRGVPTNNSFGHRSSAASAATAAMARHGDHPMTPSTAALAPLRFLTPHESGSIGVTGNWKTAPNLQLADFPKIGSHGVSTMSSASRLPICVATGDGVGVGGVSDSLPCTATASLAASRAATPSCGTDVRVETPPAERPTTFCHSSLMQGKAEEERKEVSSVTNTNNDHSNADTSGSSRQGTTLSSGVGGSGGLVTSPLSATLKADTARRLGKLMDQLPPSKYAAAIVFLEGLMSSSGNSDGVDASGSDAMSATVSVGAASARNTGHFGTTESLLADPIGVGMGLTGKPVSPLVNINVAAHAWPVPTLAQSSSLDGVPAHGVASFSGILSSNHALSGGVCIVDPLQGAEGMMDLVTKSTAAIPAAKSTGSASVDAIVRDALSQSILLTLPPTHSEVGSLSGASHSASNPTTTTTTTTAAHLKNNFTPVSKEHLPVTTVNLSSVRLDASGGPADPRLLAKATTAATTNAAAAAAATTAARAGAASSASVQSVASPGSVTAASVRSTAPLSQPASQTGQVGAPSFYKKPSGNDLSSLCPNPPVEERASGLLVGLDGPRTRRANFVHSRTSSAHNEQRSGEERERAPRRTDLQAVSIAFASAIVATADARNAPATATASTLPPSPNVATEEELPTTTSGATVSASATTTTVTTTTSASGHGEPSTDATTGSSPPPAPHVPAETAANATAPDEAKKEKENEEEEGNGGEGSSTTSGVAPAHPDDKPENPPAVSQPTAIQNPPSTTEPQDASARSSPVEHIGLSDREEPIRDVLSLLVQTSKMGNENQTPPRSHSSGSRSATTASGSSKDGAEGSTTLPAGSEVPHSKPHVPSTAEDKAQELTMLSDQRLFTSSSQAFPNNGDASHETTTGIVDSVNSTELPVRSDRSQHPAAADSLFSPICAEVAGDSSSSINADAPKLRRRRSKQNISRGSDNGGSWLENVGQSGTSTTNSPIWHYRSQGHSSPSFLQEGHTFSSPQGTSPGVCFVTSPFSPPLPESIVAAGKSYVTDDTAATDRPSESPQHFDDDDGDDLGATLRSAVVIAAATGAHVPQRSTTSAAATVASPYGTFTTVSSSQLPESFARTPFSPHGTADGYRPDYATSPSSAFPVSPQNTGYISGTGTAATPARRQHHQELHPSAASSSTLSPPLTHSSSLIVDGGRGGNRVPPSIGIVIGPDTATPGTSLLTPTTQLPPSPGLSPSHEPLATSSVAAAMNSFLSREGHVAPQEVEIVREAVARFEAFAALEETQLETLVRTMSRVELAQAQTLVQEGEPTLEKLLLVVSGKMSISRRGLVTRSVTRGQFYGEMEMSYHVERSRVTLTAVVPTTVYALTKVDYQKLVIHEKDARRYMFLQYVNQCDLFKGLSPPTKMRLADSFRVCRLRKGAKLTEQGAPVQWMYLLMSGTVRMTCKPLAQGTPAATPQSDPVSTTCSAVVAEGDTTAAATSTTASRPIVELLSSTTNPNDPAMLTSNSSMAQAPNSSSRVATTLPSPPFTPFHKPAALAKSPDGKPGTGVQELLQLAESQVFTAEQRNISGSAGASPLLAPVPPPEGHSPRLNSGSCEESNSGSANRHTHFLSSGDGMEDAFAQTHTLGKTTPSSQSEDRIAPTKDDSTPLLHKRRQTMLQIQRQPPNHHSHGHGHHRHCDPNVLNTPGSHRAGARPSILHPDFTLLGSTMASLDPGSLQRCASPSPSTASGNAKRSTSMLLAGGNPRVARAAFSGSADTITIPEETLVVVDRTRGQLVGEPEFVFKCKGLFTAVATTTVQAARISRLHFEAIMARSVVEELKRNMLLDPDYYYFESTVPSELKQEMQRLLFRLNVGRGTKRHSRLILPSSRHHGSFRGDSNEKSASRSAAMQAGGISRTAAELSASPKPLWSRQLSTSASPVLAAQMLCRYKSRDSFATLCSPTAKSTSKSRFHTVKIHCGGAAESSTGGREEEMGSTRSVTGTKLSGQRRRQRRSRRHRTAPLEPSPAPDSDGRNPASSPEDNADMSSAVVADLAVNSTGMGSSTPYLEAPSVSNHAVQGSGSSMADVSPITGDETSNHAGEVGKRAGGVSTSVVAGRSRTGTRRETVDNNTFSAKHSSTAGSRSRRISARGELVFSGSRNLYRFTADAMSLNQSIVIAVVVDGTIIRWNSVAQSVTGYAPFETIGKSVYDFIASEEGRQQMRDVLSLGTHYAGKWEQYATQHLQENRVFPFRQNSGLFQVGLALSVVPSNYAKTAEVLLLIGREAKYRAANTYASDVARWLEGLLKPQLRQFQRRMMQIESHGWRVTAEDALQVKGNLDACLSMVEQFTKFSLLNMETVNESWRPLRLPTMLGRFAVEASAFARQRRHEYYCNIEQVEPKTDIFLDAPQVLAILRLLLADAFMSPNEDDDGNPIVVHAELRVTVVEPQDAHAGPGGGSASPAIRQTPGSVGAASPASFATSFASTNPAAAGGGGGAKASPIPLFGAAASGPPSHPSNAALVILADQLSVHPHGTPNADPLLRIASSHHQQQQLHSHKEEASRAAAVAIGPQGRLSAAGAANVAVAAAADDSSGGDTPSTSAGNPTVAGTPPSCNAVAATARRAVSTTTSTPPTAHAATTGCVSLMNAGSPNTTMSASLRRIRFELRDDGPTIPSLRSPETVATESVRAAGSPDSTPPTWSGDQQALPSSPSPLHGDAFPNVASSAGLDGSRPSTGSPGPAKSTRGAELQQVEKILSNLGGLVYGFTRPEAAGNVLRVELPLLVVPGASEEGREDENGLTTGSGAPFSGASRTFTVIVADNNRVHQQQLCQILWARQHAVVPVTSFRDLVRKLEMNTADILLIDPLQIDVVSEDYESLLGDDPFDEIRILSARLALVVMTSDFSDWRVQKLLNRQAVVELPKVGSGALVHIAMQEAEQIVTEMRDEEERIDLIRRTFTNSSSERHKIGRRIGSGAFGDVYEVEDTLTGGKMAMKRMRLHDGLLADEVVQEILAMTTLKHENIIQYFYCEKESDTLLRLYMELAPGGTLRDKIREHPGVSLPFEDIVHHLSDICHGLAYVHEQRYVHGDLKTANLLLGTRGRTKIGDFGTAKRLAPHQLLYTMVGTPQYMAPEVLTADVEERLGYDFKADIWSLGCIVLEMATGNAPFAHLESAQGMGIIKYLSELTDTPDLSPLFSGNPLVYEFVKSCLDIDPKNRPTAQELLHFDILEGAVASQRAERLVKRAEMLYKLNKYAAMRADNGGGQGLAGDGRGSIDSGHGGHTAPGGSGLFFSEDDSNATEDYDYYDEEDEGDMSDDANNMFDGVDVVSASEADEEGEGEYTDEEYEFSSSGSGSDAYKRERQAAENGAEGNVNTDQTTSPADQFKSQTTQEWQPPQEPAVSPVVLMKTQHPTPHEPTEQGLPSSLGEGSAEGASPLVSTMQTSAQPQATTLGKEEMVEAAPSRAADALPTVETTAAEKGGENTWKPAEVERVAQEEEK